MLRVLFAAFAVLVVIALAAACAPREPAVPPSPLASRAVLPPPAVALAPAFTADQGIAFEGSAFVAERRGGDLELRIDYGDGTVEAALPSPGGRVALRHTYRQAGARQLVLRASGPGGETVARATVTVAPRYLVFVQGMNTESACPAGKRFLDRAPAWLAPSLAQNPALDRSMILTKANFVYFSYSGRYCDGADGGPGAAPDYRMSDTCGPIATSAGPRLRALLDSLPPGRVTIVAHSMGGLVSAWAVADDPAWARGRIASVVTFDSPLGGVGNLRTDVLGLLSFTSDRCGPRSSAISDIANGSDVIATARQAALYVPFYTLDGTRDESQALGLAEAVKSADTSIPGERLHWQVDEEHSEVWSRAPTPLDERDKGSFVACAILDDPLCGQ